jgi:hypothetical protein
MPGDEGRTTENRGIAAMKFARFGQLIPMAAAVGLLAALSTPEVAAQGGFATGFADPAAMNELNQMGGATPGTFGIDRARAVAQGDPFGAQAGDPFGSQGGFAGDPAFGDPFAAGGQPGFADGGFGPGGFDPGGFGPAGPGFGPQQPQAYRPPPTVTAYYGERIICPLTGQLLQDAVEVSVLADQVQQNYFDDGTQGGDFLEGDGIWSNVTVRNDLIAPEAALVKTRMVRALEISESLAPEQFFFEIRVASTDALSNLPQVIDLEAQRDEKLMDWAPQFLNRFRINPDDPDPMNWEFREAYVPPPPALPETPLPPNFRPPVSGPFTAAEFEQYRQSLTGGSSGGGRSSGGSGGGSASSGGDAAGGRP